MSGKDKHGYDQFSDFLRYHRRKMTDRERNVFERNLQKDPFSDEASEGFDAIDPSLAEKDILKLRKLLKERTAGKTRILWYRIAASVAVLMILSSIFIIVEKQKPSGQISYSPEPSSIQEIPVKEKQEKEPEKTGKKEPSAAIPEVTGEIPDKTIIPESKAAKRDEAGKAEIPSELRDAIMAAEVAEADKVISGEKAMAPQSVLAKSISGLPPDISGRVISSEDNRPIAGVNISVKGTNKGTVTDTGGNFSLGAEDAKNRLLVANFVGMVSKEFKAVEDSSMEIRLEPSLAALNEIVVVGYGVKGSDYEKPDPLTGYVPPRPVNGKNEFEKYILENLKRPDTATAGQRVVVVLSFNVDINGRIDSIKVIRSPAKIFSDEAIRLIKDGPEWKPAEENGKPIGDEVRIRIVFK